MRFWSSPSCHYHVSKVTGPWYPEGVQGGGLFVFLSEWSWQGMRQNKRKIHRQSGLTEALGLECLLSFTETGISDSILWSSRQHEADAHAITYMWICIRGTFNIWYIACVCWFFENKGSVEIVLRMQYLYCQRAPSPYKLLYDMGVCYTNFLLLKESIHEPQGKTVEFQVADISGKVASFLTFKKKKVTDFSLKSSHRSPSTSKMLQNE